MPYAKHTQGQDPVDGFAMANTDNLRFRVRHGLLYLGTLVPRLREVTEADVCQQVVGVLTGSRDHADVSRAVHTVNAVLAVYHHPGGHPSQRWQR
jgi:hypothetical protein